MCPTVSVEELLRTKHTQCNFCAVGKGKCQHNRMYLGKRALPNICKNKRIRVEEPTVLNAWHKAKQDSNRTTDFKQSCTR